MRPNRRAVVVLGFVGAAGYFAYRGMGGPDQFHDDLEERPPDGHIGPPPDPADVPDEGVGFEDGRTDEPPREFIE